MSQQSHTGDGNHRLVRTFQCWRIIRCRGLGENIHPCLKALPCNHFRFVFAETDGIDGRLYHNTIGSRDISIGSTGRNNRLTKADGRNNSIFRNKSYLFPIAVPTVLERLRVFRQFYRFLEIGVARRQNPFRSFKIQLRYGTGIQIHRIRLYSGNSIHFCQVRPIPGSCSGKGTVRASGAVKPDPGTILIGAVCKIADTGLGTVKVHYHGEGFSMTDRDRFVQGNTVVATQTSPAGLRPGQSRCATGGIRGILQVPVYLEAVIQICIGQSKANRPDLLVKSFGVAGGRIYIGNKPAVRYRHCGRSVTSIMVIVPVIVISGLKFKHEGSGRRVGNGLILVRNPEIALFTEIDTMAVLAQPCTGLFRRSGEVVRAVVVIPAHNCDGMVRCGISVVKVGSSFLVVEITLEVDGNANAAVAHNVVFYTVAILCIDPVSIGKMDRIIQSRCIVLHGRIRIIRIFCFRCRTNPVCQSKGCKLIVIAAEKIIVCQIGTVALCISQRIHGTAVEIIAQVPFRQIGRFLSIPEQITLTHSQCGKSPAKLPGFLILHRCNYMIFPGIIRSRKTRGKHSASATRVGMWYHKIIGDIRHIDIFLRLRFFHDFHRFRFLRQGLFCFRFLRKGLRNFGFLRYRFRNFSSLRHRFRSFGFFRHRFLRNFGF